VFVWRQVQLSGQVWEDLVRTRRRTPAGTLSNPQTLATIDSHDDPPGPRVAVAENGTATYAWEDGSLMQTRSRTATGTLSATQDVSGPTTPSAWQPAAHPLALDASGNAGFTWISPSFLIQGRTRTAAGTLGPIRRIA
jgi:cell wall assembly regulator SMI1